MAWATSLHLFRRSGHGSKVARCRRDGDLLPPQPRTARSLAQSKLQRDREHQGDRRRSGHEPELPSLQRFELAKRAKNVGRGVAPAPKAIDGELNELAHDPLSMGAEPQSDKL